MSKAAPSSIAGTGMSSGDPDTAAISPAAGDLAAATLDQRSADEVERLSKILPISTILDRLAGVLPTDLHYHTISHTQNVLNEAVRLALHDNLSSRAILLLAVAAAYHDAGYAFRRANNEELGALLAEDAMNEAKGFSSDEVALVRRMILDTQLVDNGSGLKQIANTELSKYLLDADLGNFGRDDFFDRLEAQLLESKADRQPFLKKTLALLTNHSWFTNAARALRQKKKEENIKKLTEMISSSSA